MIGEKIEVRENKDDFDIVLARNNGDVYKLDSVWKSDTRHLGPTNLKVAIDAELNDPSARDRANAIAMTWGKANPGLPISLATEPLPE